MGDDFISQEEIDALLNGDSLDNSNDSKDQESTGELTNSEMDALGELGNIGMGASATTLSSILGKKVEITTPSLKTMTLSKLKEEYSGDYVAVKVEYAKGIIGVNYLLLNQIDAKIITDLMMGGDGSNIEGEIAELHLSAIGEAMNQMIGSAATSLAQVLNTEIDISPPSAQLINASDEDWGLEGISENEPFVVTVFKMQVEGLIDSQVFQVQSFEFAKEQSEKLLSMMVPEEKEEPKKEEQKSSVGNQDSGSKNQADNGVNSLEHESSFQNPVHEAQKSNDNSNNSNNKFIDVQPANFQAFDEGKIYLDKKNVDLIMDVPLQVSVELGRTKRLIKDILEFGSGSIVELEKLAEEPVDILVNGKIVAKGEVVVIDENFGVRITEIIQNALCV